MRPRTTSGADKGILTKYDKGSMRTILIDDVKGIKAIVACPKGNYEGGKCATGTQVVILLFARSKGRTTVKAKDWFEKNEGQRRGRTGLEGVFLVRGPGYSHKL